MREKSTESAENIESTETRTQPDNIENVNFNEFQKLVDENKNAIISNIDTIPTEHRQNLIENNWKNIGSWSEAYRLAEIAQIESVEPSNMSREEYVKYAIQNNCKISDSAIRSAHWFRDCTSAEDIVQKKREIRESTSGFEEWSNKYNTFAFDIKDKLNNAKDNLLIEGTASIRALNGTQDSDSWLFFRVEKKDDDTEKENAKKNHKTYKSYISLKNVTDFTPGTILNFMKELEAQGYKGDVKFFQDPSVQSISLNDQIVLHGVDEENSKKGIDIAKNFFKNKIDKTGLGRDEVIDGKSRSYSEILAMVTKNKINKNQ